MPRSPCFGKSTNVTRAVACKRERWISTTCCCKPISCSGIIRPSGEIPELLPVCIGGWVSRYEQFAVSSYKSSCTGKQKIFALSVMTTKVFINSEAQISEIFLILKMITLMYKKITLDQKLPFNAKISLMPQTALYLTIRVEWVNRCGRQTATETKFLYTRVQTNMTRQDILHVR